MPREEMRNLHVPLPSGLYSRLREEAKRSRRPATDLAREAIDRWLAEMRRAAIHSEIAAYAATAAGTPSDLDSALEHATVEFLTAEPTDQHRKGRGKRR